MTREGNERASQLLRWILRFCTSRCCFAFYLFRDTIQSARPCLPDYEPPWVCSVPCSGCSCASAAASFATMTPRRRWKSSVARNGSRKSSAPAGASFSELRFMSGAEIHIDKGKDPVTITITGDPKQVKDARQAITQVINDAEHPDYEGEAGKKFRKDADGHAKRAEKLAIEKDALFARGDKENAHRKLDEVKAAQRAMHTSNAAAASAIFENRNKGKGNMYMDFHGLRKTEAIGLLETRTCCAFPKSRRLFTAPGRVHYS